MAGLFGVLLARPLLDLAGDAYGAIRERVHAQDEGVHLAYKGQRIGMVEGSDIGDIATRWLHVDDVARAASLPAVTLRLLEANGRVRRLGRPPAPHVEAEALHAVAARSGDPRFARWLQRTVIFPARRAAELSGVRRENAGTGR